MKNTDYDIIIIGSGPGGYTAALEAAKYGEKVAVIEKDELGGICLNRGCIPTKSIIASTELYSKIKRSKEFGINVSDLSFDWQQIIDRKNKIVLKLRKGIEFLFRNANIEFIKGIGSVKGPGSVEVQTVDGSKKTLTCANIIIAIGTESKKLPGFGSAMTSDDALQLKDLPKSLTIIGSGAIGVEFACIFNALGVEVTLTEMLPNILPNEDLEISITLEQILKRRGINVLTNNKMDPLAPRPLGPFLLATGRYFQKIEVNERMETKNKGIYAIGDVTGISMYAHTAMMQGIVASKNICGIDSAMKYDAIPSCTFSNPEIASVGLTEQQAKDKGMDYKTSKFAFGALGKSSAAGEKEGFVKLIADNKTGRIIGGHIIGSNASNIIQEIVLAVNKGLTARDIAETIHAHPTLPESVWEAARGIR